MYEMIISNIISVPLILLSFFMKKEPGLIILTSSNGLKFKDNPKYLFLHLLNQKADAKVCWATKNKSLFKHLKKNSMPCSYIFSLRHFFLVLRAEFIICDDTTNAALYNSLFWFFGKFKNVLLWHGTGFKKIGLKDDKYTRKKFSLRASLTYFIQSRRYRKYYIITATSEMDQKRKIDCFSNDKVIITGSPRNDLFFINNNNLSNQIKKRLKILSYKKIILYVPTYRERSDLNPFTEQFWDDLELYLKKNNYLFIVKKHLYDKILQVPCKDNIMDVTQIISDVQELLLVSDILISDYSSIVTDFVLMGKPILFYTYDINNYVKNCRSFYFDIKKILPGPFIQDEKDLFKFISSKKWFNDKKYKKSYNRFKSFFQQYEDANSCQRVQKVLLSR